RPDQRAGQLGGQGRVRRPTTVRAGPLLGWLGAANDVRPRRAGLPGVSDASRRSAVAEWSSVEDAFEAAVAPQLADPRVTRGRKQPGCEVDGKVFAMVSTGQLVVKLPRARVEALTASGTGGPLRMGARVMKEWFALASGRDGEFPALVDEARRFVGGG